MLSSVLRSKRAVEVNIAIMRTFVQLRRLMDTNRDLARKIDALEKKYDEQFAAVFEAIRQLISPAPPPSKQIGFHPGLSWLCFRLPIRESRIGSCYAALDFLFGCNRLTSGASALSPYLFALCFSRVRRSLLRGSRSPTA